MEGQKGEINELSDQHKAFCERYIFDWNQTRAYMDIYPDCTYESAKALASKLLTNINVKAYIEHIQKDIAKIAGVSVLKNVKELAKVAYTDITDLKNGWMDVKDFDKLTKEQKAALSEITYEERETKAGKQKIVKFKVHDKIKAIEVMNKMLGFNSPEKLEVDPGEKSISTFGTISDFLLDNKNKTP